jgi:polyhydroxyalkanoate synthesis repressor PhaR
MLVKKYGNRRLYDTEASRYITLEDLTAAIRDGAEARVVDAKTGQDLTQETLTQIIMEGRGGDRILPAQLLHQLIRLGDDALADFLGRYVQAALELYLTAKKTTQAFMPFNPLVALTQFANNTPFFSPNAVTPRGFDGGWNQQSTTPVPVPSVASPPPNDVEQLRKELDELKGMLRKRKK